MSTRARLVLVMLLVWAGCDSGGSTVTTPVTTTAATSSSTSSSSTTTTTVDPTLTCGDIADQAQDLMQRIVAELEGMPAGDLTDRDRWPDELVALQAEGRDLDRRVTVTGCDPGRIQEAAVAVLEGAAPEGRVAEILVELLAP